MIRRHLRFIASLLALAIVVFTCTNPVRAQVTLVGNGWSGGAITSASSFLDGTNFSIKNTADPTKVVQFDATQMTTGNTETGLCFAGTAATPEVRIGQNCTANYAGTKHDGTNVVFNAGAGGYSFSEGGNVKFGHYSGQLNLGNAQVFGFSSNADPSLAATDTTLNRTAAGVFGQAAGTWIQATNARSMLAGDYTNATATFSATALSITVKTGRKYTFQAVLFLIDSTAAEGAQIDFNGGSAAATNFRVHCLHYDTTAAVLKSTQVTALATVADSVASTGTGQNEVVCNGSFEPSGNGTFIIRGAQISHTSGTLTINRGSYLSLEDMP